MTPGSFGTNMDLSAIGPVAIPRRGRSGAEEGTDGSRYSLDSALRVDAGDRRLHWGTAGDDGYRGWLQVTDASPGSRVRIHVAVPDDRLGPSGGAAAEEIRRGMEDAFDRLAGLIGN